MTLALRSIAAAIALRYDPSTISGSTPAGAQAIASSSASIPEQLGQLPLVLVFPDAGAMTYGPQQRAGELDWLVRLYYGQIAADSLERDTDELLDWLGVFVDRHLVSSSLGGLVVVTQARGYRVGLLRFAGRDYSGLELRVHTVTREPWSGTP